ncbi:MAG: NAD(P)-dependent oxidoreductase [Verrucomicrobia bacterium]|nr:NAD(P)-dependent oxidoreductase [Verrucomicrobiota bacterium]
MPAPAKLSTKQRLQINRQKMTEQDPLVRNANFGEVNLGLPEKVALLEAERCLLCKDPKCITGCPVGVNIPRFVELLSQGNLPEAAQCLLSDNALPAVTGRVCPQETQCEIECIRGNKGLPVAIGYLERYVGDWARTHSDQQSLQIAPPSGKKVAVVGSGPGGLTAAGELAKCGHDVTVFEALHKPGGVLVYGIPEFRLPKRIVQEEVGRLERSGVKIVCNTVIGRTYTVPELREQFDAVFIANGAGLPVFMNVPGENYKGVYSANEYLTRVNLMAAYQFPRSDTHAEEEGLQFEFLVAPVEVVGNEKKWVTGLKCVRMQLGEPDASGRARPIIIPGSEFVVPCDVVVVAIGTRANPLLTATCPDLKLNKWGNIIVDDNCMTNLPGVFAGGDIVRGAATVILAMGDGKRAGKAMNEYLLSVQA